MTRAEFACIVGAPRCGTTTLAGFLQDHPGVSFSSVKEPHFFAGHDLTSVPETQLRSIVGSQYLERFFQPQSSGARMLAEGSVSYLYMARQMEPLLHLWPSARFIIAVRNPIDMLPSLHRRLLYTGDETVRNFGRAWNMTSKRRNGFKIPRSCIDSRLLLYDEIGRLGHYVDQFFRTVGRERCHVVVFDDLVESPAAVHSALLDFLGLPPMERQDFVPRRQSLDFRFGWLQRLLKRPPTFTRSFLAGEKFRRRIQPLNGGQTNSPMLRNVFAARRRLLNWNSMPARQIVISPSLRDALRDTFAADIGHLSQVIDRDLSSWLDDRPVPEEAQLPGRLTPAMQGTF